MRCDRRRTNLSDATENSMPEIEVYTQDWCPYCTRAKQVLDKKGVTYKEIDAPAGSAAPCIGCPDRGLDLREEHSADRRASLYVVSWNKAHPRGA